jgi:hypothetical protein
MKNKSHEEWRFPASKWAKGINKNHPEIESLVKPKCRFGFWTHQQSSSWLFLHQYAWKKDGFAFFEMLDNVTYLFLQPPWWVCQVIWIQCAWLFIKTNQPQRFGAVEKCYKPDRKSRKNEKN